MPAAPSLAPPSYRWFCAPPSAQAEEKARLDAEWAAKQRAIELSKAEEEEALERQSRMQVGCIPACNLTAASFAVFTCSMLLSRQGTGASRGQSVGIFALFQYCRYGDGTWKGGCSVGGSSAAAVLRCGWVFFASKRHDMTCLNAAILWPQRSLHLCCVSCSFARPTAPQAAERHRQEVEKTRLAAEEEKRKRKEIVAK